ncbi:putative oxidoreductase yfjR [Rosellinia necatrix]|uniref:Putative oxidoreductase yfjR n=1 Tax=Rosellinia necatrix TaxID=77044 RepID=A0A1W2TWG0_ROSNE|nr:putative oxidoreductase yfjR [Rosellinia necatrix]
MTSASPSHEAPARVGWIGLGSMGNAMAKNIHAHLRSRHGASLLFHNRTASRGDALAALGGERCASVASLAAHCDVIFVSASDDAAVESIVGQIVSAERGAAGKIVVDTTTIHPDTTRAVAETLRARGARFAAAPVFGATPVAERGELLVVFAGPRDLYGAIAPMLEGVIARKVLRVGEEPEKATLLKTIGNFVTVGLMEVIAEAHVLAEKTGLGAEALEQLLALNYGTVAHSISTRMTTGVYMPGRGEAPWSDLNLAIKDVGHGVDSARRAGVSLDVGSAALAHLERARAYSEANGQRPLDSSSLYGIVRQDSGLDFRTDHVKERDQ